EGIGPGVVRTLEGPADLALLFGAQPRAAMPADVEERLDRPVPAARHQHALASDLDRLELPGLGQIRTEHGAEPPGFEDVLLLQPEGLGVGVVMPGQGLAQALRELVGLLVSGGKLTGRHGSRSSSKGEADRKSTRLNSSHVKISYAVFCLKKKNEKIV